MKHSYLKLYVLFFFTGVFCPMSQAQVVYSTGRLELTDGSLKTGDLAWQTSKTGTQLLFRTGPGEAPVAYAANALRSFQLGNEHYISWRPNADSTTSAVFLRNLVAGQVGLYLYERNDGVNVFLLEQQGVFTPINALQPSATLATLPDCGPLRPAGFDSPFSLTSRQLVRYILAYNRCRQPGTATESFETAPRLLKVSIGPRVFLPVSSCRLQFNDGASSPQSTISAKPGFGLSVNFTWRGRLGLGLDLALLSRHAAWNTDTSAKRVWALDELTTRSLVVNPYLRYEFRHHSSQAFTPYITLGLVYNRLLNGDLVINRNFPTQYDPYNIYVIREPTKLAINKEAGIDEFGGSLGGGLLWQLNTRLQAVADVRVVYSAAILSVFELPSLSVAKVQFPPRTYLINSSFGLNFRL